MRKITSILLIFFCLTACAKKYSAPEIGMPSQWPGNISEEVCEGSPDEYQWWQKLNDPTLSSLIERASTQNLDLYIAASQLCTDSSIENYRDIQISLYADAAKNYIELRGYQQGLILIEKNIANQKVRTNLIHDLVNTGFKGSADYLQAKGMLNDMLAKRPQIQDSINKTIYRLSVLLGYQPDELYCELANPAPLPSIPIQRPVGIPPELLKRRPDIQKAERDYAAAAQDKLQAQQAFYQYQKVVLNALEEAEDALAAFHYDMEMDQYLAEAKRSYQNSSNLTFQLYQRGLKDYLEVIESSQSYLHAEDALLQNQIKLLLDYVALYKALAGGFCLQCIELSGS